MSIPTTSSQFNQEAEEYFLQGNYTQAVRIYEEAINANPEIKSNYWYLGLTLLLQGQEAEAQTTWFMAMMEGEPEDVEIWNTELISILLTEAERQENLEEYTQARKIRIQIKEIEPQDIANLLHLVHLSIKLEVYTSKTLGFFRIFYGESKK